MGVLKAYLTAGSIYARYDVATDQMDPGLGYPKPVLGGGSEGGWGLAGTGMENGFDTALDDGYGKVWFFLGDQCVRVDNHTRALDRDPTTIDDAFPGLGDAGFGEGLWAAANWLDERAYFTRADMCLAYDLVRREVLWGPVPLADEFEGLAEAGFAAGPFAVTTWPNGKAYFFLEGSYVRLDRATMRVDGAPAPVFGNWPGLPEDLCASVTAAWVKTELLASVGRSATGAVRNDADDQRHVARLLDRVPVVLGGTGAAGPTLWRLPQDGICADDLADAILNFQQTQGLSADGHIDPADAGGNAIGRLVTLADTPLPGPVELRLAQLAFQGVDLGAELGGLDGMLADLGRRFANGLVVGLTAADAVLVRGLAVDAWLAAGALDGSLGAPLGDSVAVPDGAAVVTTFAGGTLVETADDGMVRTLSPAVGERYLAAAWDPGLPLDDAGSAGPEDAGTYQAFSNAVAVTDPDDATFLTLPPLFAAWQAGLGDDLADLGWPVADATADENGLMRQAFTGGTLALALDGSVTREEHPIAGAEASLQRYLLPHDPRRHLASASSDNEVTFFVGAGGAFADMAATMLAATGPRDFIYLLSWFCEIDLELVPGQPWSTPRSLFAAATHHGGDGNGAEVCALLWQAKEKPPSLGADIWEAARAFTFLKFFGGPPLSFINYRAVQYIDALPTSKAVLDDATLLAGSHHQKVLIVRAGDRLVAYCGGMDLNPDRLHPNGVKGSRATGAPLHDVHLKIEGPGAFELLQTFTERWHATPTAAEPLRGDTFAPVGGAVAGPHFVQISHTYGKGYPFPVAVQTGREVLENALRSARRYVYMECQYYVGNDHLRSALRAALHTVEAVIVVAAPLDAVDDLPDLAFRRQAFITPLKAEFGDKLLVFEHLGEPPGTTTPGAYVHAKIMLVDDEASFVGTLNYSNRSWSHDSEVMATIVDSRGPAGLGPLPGLTPMLRETLWSMHLGPSVAPAQLHDIGQALAHFRSLPATARLRPYDHAAPITRPNVQGIAMPPTVLDQYWDVLADPRG